MSEIGKVEYLRIVHIEDDWEQFRTLPNNLYDTVYMRASPEVRVTIDFEEFPNGFSEEHPSKYVWRTFITNDKILLFEYVLVDGVDSLKLLDLSENDFFVIDIMQTGDDGRAKEVLSEVIDYLQSAKIKYRGSMYFSAFPEFCPPEVNIEGVDKGELSNFLGAIQMLLFSQFTSFDESDKNWRLDTEDLGMRSVLDD